MTTTKSEIKSAHVNEVKMESFVPFALDGAGNLWGAGLFSVLHRRQIYTRLAGNVRGGLWEVWLNWSYYSRKCNAYCTICRLGCLFLFCVAQVALVFLYLLFVLFVVVL